MVVRDSGSEVLTKHEKEWKDVCYNLKDQGNDGSDDEEGGCLLYTSDAADE